jgi:anti-anti-sigma factor
MTVTGLEASVRHRPPAAILDLRGELNASGEEVLKNAYAEAGSRQARLIILNFVGVDYINSTGIALIVSLLIEARQAGQRVAACGLCSHYVEIFQITRLAVYIQIFSDEASAFASATAFMTEKQTE